jgi:hypothetical protein
MAMEACFAIGGETTWKRRISSNGRGDHERHDTAGGQRKRRAARRMRTAVGGVKMLFEDVWHVWEIEKPDRLRPHLKHLHHLPVHAPLFIVGRASLSAKNIELIIFFTYIDTLVPHLYSFISSHCISTTIDKYRSSRSPLSY